MAVYKIAVLVILMALFVCDTVAAPVDKGDGKECTEEEVAMTNLVNIMLSQDSADFDDLIKFLNKPEILNKLEKDKGAALKSIIKEFEESH